MNWFSRLFSGGTSKVIDSVGKAGSVFLGDKGARENAEHLENMAVHNQHAAEYSYRGTRFYIDAFVDTANRLVRPSFTYGITAIFGWATWGASDFLDFTARLATIPQPLWVVMGTVIAFWFGSRSIFKDRQNFKIEKDYVKGVYKAAADIREFVTPEDLAINERGSNKTIAEFKKTSKKG